MGAFVGSSGGGGGAYGGSRKGKKKEKGGGPSVLSRVFDILSRGQYVAAGTERAMTKTMKDISQGKMPDLTLQPKEFWGGISGKKKNTFAQVFKESGAPDNPATTIAGLVADIGLDPSTYFGAGTTKIPAKLAEALKVAGKASEARTAGKAAARLVEDLKKGRTPIVDVTKKTLPPDIVQTASGKLKETRYGTFVSPKKFPQVTDLPKMGLGPMPSKATGAAKAVSSALHLGEDIQPSLFSIPELAETVPKIVTKPAESVAKHLAEAGGRAAKPSVLTARGAADAGLPLNKIADLALSEAPLKKALQIKVGGKVVAQSERAGDLLRLAASPVGKTGIPELIKQSFSTTHGMLPQVHNLQRIFAGRGLQNIAEKAKEVQQIVKGIPKADLEKIYTHIQEGTTHLLPDHLQDTSKFFQQELDNLRHLNGEEVLPGMNLSKFEDIPRFAGDKKFYNHAPQAFIAQYDRAIRKRAFLDFKDEVARRFPEKSPEIEANLKKAREIFGVNGEVSAKWQHYMGAVQNPWKKWITVYRPGHHIRNMSGDVFNAYLAGTHPSRFKDSAKVITHMSGNKIKETIKIGGQKFTADEIDRFYKLGGLETSFTEAEMLGGRSNVVSRGITTFSEKREKFTRMATFIDSLDRSLKKGKSIDTAIEDAAMRVRKYHFDYADLTPFERKLRTFIPFYTYTRKELPLILEHTLTTPGKMVVPKKAGSALESLLGVQSDPNDPFPGIEGMLPEYLRDQQVIQRGNNNIFVPGLPTDLLSMLGPAGAVEQTANSITPLIKAPLEMATGKSFPTGYSLKHAGQSNNEALIRYLLSYGPYGNLARDSKSTIRERLLNMLTGAGARKVR